MAPTFNTTAHGLRVLPGGNLISDIDAGFSALGDDSDAMFGAAAGAAAQEGVIDAGSFEVTQASGGAGMTLDVASNVGSGAYVQDDSTARRAIYYVAPTGAKSTVTVTTAHATNPRVDSVYMTVAGVVTYIAGTATAGATLDNARDGSHGGPTIPASALHLADLLVPATDTTISNNQIRDRRKWARGAYAVIISTGTFSTTSTTMTTISSSLTLRVECSGNPLRVTLDTTWGSGANDARAQFDVVQDGSAINRSKTSTNRITAGATHFHSEWEITPVAGSHTFTPGFLMVTGATNVTVPAIGGEEVMFRVEEIVRQSTKNNATTSG